MTALHITALILAGGNGLRMGRINKGLIDCNGRALIDYALQQITPQVEHVLISANTDLDQYRRYHWPVIPDLDFPDCGPLAGMYQAMINCTTDYLLTLPCDAPLISPLYARRMWQAVQASGQAAVASNHQALQPVFALLPTSCSRHLAQYLRQGGRRTREWIMQQNPIIVDFSDQEQMFTNINTPDNLARWQQDHLHA